MQFASVGRAEHHRVSVWFLDPAHPGGLRQDVERMQADGSGMSARLKAAVSSLRWTPLDDCVAEGPHAAAKRTKVAASAAKWAWVAASMRLSQNIAQCEALALPGSACSLNAVWTAWSTVVQPPSRASRCPKMKFAALLRKVYRLDHLLGFRATCSGVPAIADASSSTAPALTWGDIGAEDVAEGPIAGAAAEALQ